MEYKQKLTTKTIKILGENKENLYDQELGKFFLERTQKEETIKEDIDENWTSSKLKTCPFLKSPLRTGMTQMSRTAPPAGVASTSPQLD